MSKKTAEKKDEPKEAKSCKRCGKPISNPNGDNGCGIHTLGEKTVTNCVPAE